jgi:hypothetical protein
VKKFLPCRRLLEELILREPLESLDLLLFLVSLLGGLVLINNYIISLILNIQILKKLNKIDLKTIH